MTDCRYDRDYFSSAANWNAFSVRKSVHVCISRRIFAQCDHYICTNK